MNDMFKQTFGRHEATPISPDVKASLEDGVRGQCILSQSITAPIPRTLSDTIHGFANLRAQGTWLLPENHRYTLRLHGFFYKRNGEPDVFQVGAMIAHVGFREDRTPLVASSMFTPVYDDQSFQIHPMEDQRLFMMTRFEIFG